MSATIQSAGHVATVTDGVWSGHPFLVKAARSMTVGLEPTGCIPNFDNYLADYVVRHLGGEVIERASVRFDDTLGVP